MLKHIFIGVDGGATKCVVRVEDEVGQLLGLGTGGPANIRISVEQAWQSINVVLNRILQQLPITREEQGYCYHVGMGIAGCEVAAAYESFVSYPHIFSTLQVTGDAHIACLGAHQGQDGAIIIAGTGVVGLQTEQGKVAKVGGWGFPHDDEGGGAWLGMEAVKVTLQWLDGRLPASPLAKAVFAQFKQQHGELVAWANQANSTVFASLAPLVIEHSKLGDVAAISIMQRAAHALDQVGQALAAAQVEKAPLPCSLIGSIAPHLEPYLTIRLRSRLRPGLASPDAGAILLARQCFKVTGQS